MKTIIEGNAKEKVLFLNGSGELLYNNIKVSNEATKVKEKVNVGLIYRYIGLINRNE